MTKLYPHQEMALRKLSNGKVLWGGVGSGKTRVAAEYYLLREAPRDVYVITTAKKRDSFDWQDEFYRAGIGPTGGPAALHRDQDDGGSGRSPQTRGRLPRKDAQVRLHDGGSVQRLSVDEHKIRVLVSDTTERNVSHDGERHHRDASSPDVQRDSLSRESRSDRGQSSEKIGGAIGVSVEGAGASRDRFGSASAGSVVLPKDERGVDVGGFGGQPGVYPYVLTVDSWNNIAKYADVAGAFFIFDEQRLVGSGDWSRKFLRIAKHNHWILLTATPGDTWMDYIPLFVANNFYKNRTEFKREHVVYNTFTKFPKVDRYINVGRLVRQRKQLLVEMPYERHTRRRHVEVELPYDKEALQTVIKQRWNVFEDRPLRDVAEMCSVSRKIVNGDPSRLEMVRELWKNHPKLIVFYNFNYELEMLRSLASFSAVSTMKSGTKTKTATSGSGPMISTPTSIGGSFKTSSSSDTCVSLESAKNSTGSREIFGCMDGATGSTDRALLLDRTGENETWTVRVAKDGSRDLSEKSTSPTQSSRESFSNNKVPILSRGVSASTSRDSSQSGKRTFSAASTNTSLQESGMTVGLGEWNGHKHQPVPKTDRWIYLVQYTAGAEGWNCIETDAMIMFSRHYSWKVTEQAYGRIDRLNSPFTDLWYYGFTSDSWIDRAISRAFRAKETFNESAYKDLFQ